MEVPVLGPVSLELSLSVVIVKCPAVTPTTFTLIEQLLPANGNAPPVKESDVSPAFGEKRPPQLPVTLGGRLPSNQDLRVR